MTTYEEDRAFRKWSQLERQVMYTRGCCMKHCYDAKKLGKILKRKFGVCVLTSKQRKELAIHFKESAQ